MPDDSQGGLRGDLVLRNGQDDGTRDNDFDLKDRGKTNEINLLTAENRALTAARDHLRARLRALYDTWLQASADYRANADAAYSDDVAFMWSARGERSLTCAADLLAVLTQPEETKDDQSRGRTLC